MSGPGGAGTAYGIDNLPYAVAVTSSGRRRVVVRIGERALDVSAALRDIAPARAELFAGGTLDAFLAAGPSAWEDVRSHLTSRLTEDAGPAGLEPALEAVDRLEFALPFTVADFADFNASAEHAANVGRILRPGQAPLRENWRRIPVGYHGRAGTVVVSGTSVRRPAGPRPHASGGEIEAGPSRKLDFEAELGYVVGVPSRPGEPLRPQDFDSHVFGVVLLNDWSARDIQAYEYVPLGPFLGKSFATSISAWVTPLAALHTARVPTPPHEPSPPEYLADDATAGLDLDLEIELNGQVISRPPYAGMYWSGAQMLAHLTVNGAPVRTGDLYGSGTVSGPAHDQCGSLIELTRDGAAPLLLPDGTTRDYLHDGDEVVVRATAPGRVDRIALGEVRGVIAG